MNFPLSSNLQKEAGPIWIIVLNIIVKLLLSYSFVDCSNRDLERPDGPRVKVYEAGTKWKGLNLYGLFYIHFPFQQGLLFNIETDFVR